MYVVKMENNKDLISTVKGKIYQGERNADTLVFLIPRTYTVSLDETLDFADCVMLLRYRLPNGIGKSEEIEMDAEPYNDDFYRYFLKVNSRLTEEDGTITLWLTAIDMHNSVVMESSELTIEVLPTYNIEESFCMKDLSQLDRLTVEVAGLKQNKVDNLLYNNETRKLQLRSGITKVGRPVTVPANTYAKDVSDSFEDIWYDMADEKPIDGDVWQDM